MPMADETLQALNAQRKAEYLKPPVDENFLSDLNQELLPWELAAYQDYPESQPFIFVFGVPRSGTTLLGQLVAYCLDVGYINNLSARFWLAPVTGIRLSKIMLGGKKDTSFESHYATTHDLSDLHEFGYFWRYWLKKESLDSFVHAAENEHTIDWVGLKRTLLNIQNEFGKAVAFKNIFGAYHIERFIQLLDKCLFVYIERDPVDNAISILSAREKFYSDPRLWWSTVPLEYERLKDLPALEQIGGQVYFLRQFYQRQFETIAHTRIVKTTYKEVCENPAQVLRKIQENSLHYFGDELSIVEKPPAQFKYRRYLDDPELRDRFEKILAKIGSVSSGISSQT
jgi:hypothetical protein